MIVDDLTKLHANMTYLCAPSGGSRTVRYIDIVEIPEGSAWTSPGDLIITTGYFLQSPADFERFVTRLIDNQVVGLGIKIGKYVHQIPDSVRELAEENRFPILSIPMELSYRDIQRILLHSREDGPSGAAQTTGRSDIVAFYSQVLLGGDRSLSGLKTLSERAGLSFRSDRLIFAAAMDPGTAKDAIDRLLLRPSPDFFLLYDELRQQIVGIFTLRPGASAEQGLQYGQQLFYSYCNPGCTVGISELSTTAATLRSAYEHAGVALEIGRCCAPRKPVYRYTDYIEYAFIRENMDSGTLLQMVEEYLRPVMDYDQRKSAELVKTLCVADECSYNMQKTCALLGIHRNTLYDRIRKIGKLLRHDLNAKSVRDAIHLALIWRQLSLLE